MYLANFCFFLGKTFLYSRVVFLRELAELLVVNIVIDNAVIVIDTVIIQLQTLSFNATMGSHLNWQLFCFGQNVF